MSIIFRRDGAEVLLLTPICFRRMYTLADGKGAALNYSHSDVVVALENEKRAMLEIVQGLLPKARYMVKMMPTEAVFVFDLGNGKESLRHLKELVFWNFPDLKTRDMYLNDDLTSDDLDDLG